MSSRSPAGPAALSTEQLEQINRLTIIARFVAGLAHELNNSLQVMGGLVELLAERRDLPPDVVARIERIGGQADRAGAAIRQVVDYVRGADAARGALDLGAVVERALALRRYQLARSGIAAGLDRSDRMVRVSGDERQLQQAILNLLVNAEEAVEGQAERRIGLTISDATGRATLAISDSGPGVQPELRARIFEPFFTTSRSGRAVGLGLTVAAAIAEAHGGRLYLAGNGAGATFVLELPMLLPGG